MIRTILEEVVTRDLTREEAIKLLGIDNKSDEFYDLIKVSNRMTRERFGNKAYIFSQIGLNAEPCSMNCKFCSMAKSNYVMDGEFRKTMAVMRRTPVPGTPLEAKGMITAAELTKIEAVTRLVTKPVRSMNTHEVTPMTLIAGVNQLYAEIGANPRDNVNDTEANRGYGVQKTIELLRDAEFEVDLA